MWPALKVSQPPSEIARCVVYSPAEGSLVEFGHYGSCGSLIRDRRKDEGLEEEEEEVALLAQPARRS